LTIFYQIVLTHSMISYWHHHVICPSHFALWHNY